MLLASSYYGHVVSLKSYNIYTAQVGWTLFVVDIYLFFRLCISITCSIVLSHCRKFPCVPLPHVYNWQNASKMPNIFFFVVWNQLLPHCSWLIHTLKIHLWKESVKKFHFDLWMSLIDPSDYFYIYSAVSFLNSL